MVVVELMMPAGDTAPLACGVSSSKIEYRYAMSGHAARPRPTSPANTDGAGLPLFGNGVQRRVERS